MPNAISHHQEIPFALTSISSSVILDTSFVAGIALGAAVTALTSTYLHVAARRIAAQATEERYQQASLAQEKLAEQITAALAERAHLAGRLEALRESQSEQAGFVDVVVARVGEQLSTTHQAALASAHQAVEQLTASQATRLAALFTAQSSHQHQLIDGMLQPVQESLRSIAELTTQVERGRAGVDGEMRAVLSQLAERQSDLNRATQSLSRALRTPHIRGQWGEQQLDTMLDLAGMLEGVHFDRQPTIKGDDGCIRPDIVLRLPEGRGLIVDSKAPLDALLAALEIEGGAAQRDLLDKHVKQLKTHITALGSKDYPAKLGTTAAEGVILFLPSETILSASLKRDPGLLEYAMTRGVFLCTPTTLLVVLSTVTHLCKHARIAENADQLRALAVELYDRVATLLEPVSKMGRGLSATLESYNAMIACLDTRVTATARKVKALGASSAKTLLATPRVEGLPRQLRAREFTQGDLTIREATERGVATHADGVQASAVPESTSRPQAA